jgi:hypothetical protein
MNLYMSPEELRAAARANDTNTAEALQAAQEAVTNLVALRNSMIFGPSPAGKKTDMVFDKSSTAIDELIAEVSKAITVLTQNLHLSVDLVVRDQEAAQIDFNKLARDNRNHVNTLDTTGIQPGDQTYQDPTTTPTDPATAPAGSDAGTPADTTTPPSTDASAPAAATPASQPTSGDSGN